MSVAASLLSLYAIVAYIPIILTFYSPFRHDAWVLTMRQLCIFAFILEVVSVSDE
jgi:hypothetical protein